MGETDTVPAEPTPQAVPENTAAPTPTAAPAAPPAAQDTMAITLPDDFEPNASPNPNPSWFTPKRLLLVFCVINMLNYVDRGAIASNGVNGSLGTCTESGICTSGRGIQGDFELNNFKDGLLSSAFMVGLLVASPIFASLAKSYNPFRLIGVGLSFWTIATLGCGFSFDFWSITIFRMLVGVGEASFISLAAPFIDDNAPVAQKTAWLALFYMCIPTGIAIGYVYGGVVGSNLHWRFAFWGESILMLPFAILGFIIKPLKLKGFASSNSPREKGYGEMTVPEVEATQHIPISNVHNFKSEIAGADEGNISDEASEKVSLSNVSSKILIQLSRFWKDMKALLMEKVYVINVLGYIAYNFVIGAYSYWGPKAGFSIYHMSNPDLVFGGITIICGIVGTLAGGYILDRMHSTISNAFKLLTVATFLGAVFCFGAFCFKSLYGFIALFSIGELLVFATQGPVNYICLHSVKPSLRPLSMAMSTVSIHIFGDVPSSPLVGVLWRGRAGSFGHGGSSLSSFFSSSSSHYNCYLNPNPTIIGSRSPPLHPELCYITGFWSAMAEVPKLLYIVVVDDEGGRGGGRNGDGEMRERASFRYTRSLLQSTLQLMGCKARHAFKMSRRVFEVIRTEMRGDLEKDSLNNRSKDRREDGGIFGLDQENVDPSNTIPFELYKRLTTAVVPREIFLKVTCDALSQYKYVGPNQRADLILACRIRERKESVTVLLCGTSGCGKSTLSALLGSRLGVTTVISTDSIRHMMRSFADEKQNPLLWASTYHAGECLDPVAVAEAKAKRRAMKLAGVSMAVVKEELPGGGASKEKPGVRSLEQVPGTELIGQKQMAVEGFKAQSEMVIDSLDRLITAWEERKESVVVEGVHLSLNFVMGLMKKHPSIIPFMVFITNEEKHMERFAVRAKYMTLDPSKNKYVKYIRNIRTIQDYLCNRADKHLVPKINNTNVDRSVASIHATVFSCLRRREAGEPLYDSATNTVSIVHEEYRNQCAADSLSSKGMFQLIQRQGSSRHLMALLNTDGSVAKAWPVESADGNSNSTSGNNEKRVGSPMYGPLPIGKAEHVNLQFGNFGISAWPSDVCGTSHAGSQTGSFDDLKADGTDTGSRHFSSCCSSPRFSDPAAKELKENLLVSGSDEEADDPPDVDSDDEDLSDGDQRQIHDEEGSVDEDSTKYDEEYDDLAMQDDGQENGYWSDNDEGMAKEKKPTFEKESNQNSSTSNAEDTGKYQQNLDLFLKLSERFAEAQCSYTLLPERKERSADARARTRSLSDYSRLHSQLQSILSTGECGTMIRGPMVSAAPLM